jgi:phosphoribosyl-ATP pyrophosphohydrolase
MIIPSIDLMGGKAVKLVKGDKTRKMFEKDALELADEFSIYPQINLIDLDAAFGIGNNEELIKKIMKICSCNVGGGIRTIEKAYDYLKAGARRLIIGTAADKEFLVRLPKEKIIVAIDSRDGMITDRGWQNTTGSTTQDRMIELNDYCSGFLYTDVEKEGMMIEIDIPKILNLRSLTKNGFLYAGGISDVGSVKILSNYDIDSVIGMAYYTCGLNMIDGFIETIDFNKSNGVVPTIVKDDYGSILMLAYSSRESLKQALSGRKGIYYSRSRKEIWIKGQSSGNVQTLQKISSDCDEDSLIFVVKQENNACHTGKYSCFGESGFEFDELIDKIKKRIGTGSFTDKMIDDRDELNKKIMEECSEVVNFKDIDNLRWEITDLIYFISILMAKNGISYKEVKNELMVRSFMKTYIKTTKL